uniref:Uncharacterized protein n=1 Tax=Oryza meridionalis TaxID=40149 RepID=A0A0E0DJB8_9ORYZ
MEEDLLPRDDPSAVLLDEARPTPPTGRFNLHHAFLRGINGILYYTPEILGVGGFFSKFDLSSSSTSIPLSAITTLEQVPETKGIPLEVLSECFASTNISSKDDSKEDK